MIYIVTNKATGKEVYRYQADSPDEWNGMEFATHDHIEQPAVENVAESINVEQWRIHVGAFFDRFGGSKVGILASSNPYIQAVIKDASVRQYIALKERRDDLLDALNLLVSQGFAIDPAAILDTIPAGSEVWNG